MRNLNLDQDTKITLYLKECYTCDTSKYTPLHRFIIDQQLKMTNFIVKRVEVNLEWQQEARSLDMELPAVVFENKRGDKYAITYLEFLRKLKNRRSDSKGGSAKPKAVPKGAVSESRVTDGNPPFLNKVEEVKDGRSRTNKSTKTKNKAKPKKDRKD